ncbi:MAG TPA: tail fiber domain-containing protein [Dissulfurispiraceae bacterium]
MKRTAIGILMCVLCTVVNVFGADGDLIVNGNVGVGTSTPGAKLTVDIPSGSCGAARARFYYCSNAYSGIYGEVFHDGDASGLTLQARGSTYGSGDISFWGGITTPVEVMRIKYTGNVAIGTTDPGGYKLFVAGPAWFSSAYTNGAVWAGSDIRLKKNIVPLEGSLEKVVKLQGVSYEWRRDEFKEKNFEEGRQIGLIAQEVENVFPELVRTDKEGYKAISYEKLTAVLVEALKEQQRKLNVLEEQIKAFQKRN